MSILSAPDSASPDDPQSLAAVVARAAAEGDWKAAAWLLEHHPAHRLRWGNTEQLQSAVLRTVALVAKAIERDQSITAEQKVALVLGMQSLGVGGLPCQELTRECGGDD